MTTLIELRGAVEAAIRRGESFSTIEAEIIDSSPVPENAQSALWLYAMVVCGPVRSATRGLRAHRADRRVFRTRIGIQLAGHALGFAAGRIGRDASCSTT